MKLPKLFKNKAKERKKSNNQFIIFILCALFIATCLAGFSLWLYGESGAAQLDLSRPSYQEAREKAKAEKDAEKENKEEDSFASGGEVTKKTIEDFEKLYNEHLKKAKNSSFNKNSLSDETLNIPEKD